MIILKKNYNINELYHLIIEFIINNFKCDFFYIITLMLDYLYHLLLFNNFFFWNICHLNFLLIISYINLSNFKVKFIVHLILVEILYLIIYLLANLNIINIVIFKVFSNYSKFIKIFELIFRSFLFKIRVRSFKIILIFKFVFIFSYYLKV
jgi:hypothetical protein